jgi:hypothetical protein
VLRKVDAHSQEITNDVCCMHMAFSSHSQNNRPARSKGHVPLPRIATIAVRPKWFHRSQPLESRIPQGITALND